MLLAVPSVLWKLFLFKTGEDKIWEEIRFQLLNKSTMQCHVLGFSDVFGDTKILNSLWLSLDSCSL